MSGQPPPPRLTYDVLASPLGPLTLVTTQEGLAGLAFGERHPQATATPGAREHLADARRQLEEYFAGTRCDFDLALDLPVPPGFGREVLQAAAAVRYGSVATYRELAAAVGRPKAARAVGNALGANPVAIVVPCHRIVRSDGAHGGYTSGRAKKEFLLGLEASRGAPTER